MKTAIDGIWSAQFSSSLGVVGSGVVIFDNGRILGGDDAYYFNGKFITTGSRVIGTVDVVQHQSGQQSIWGGVSSLVLIVEGSYDEPWIFARMQGDQNPLITGNVKLKRLVKF